MKRTTLIAVLPLLALLALWGCSDDTDTVVETPATDKTCIGCHSSETELLAALGKEEGSKFTRYDKGDG
jgi:hypothetical protein